MSVAKPALGTAEMSTTSPLPYSMVMVPPISVYEARCIAAGAVVEDVDVVLVVTAVVPGVDVEVEVVLAGGGVTVEDGADVLVAPVLTVDDVTPSGSVVDEFLDVELDVSSGTTTTSPAGSGSSTGTPADSGYSGC